MDRTALLKTVYDALGEGDLETIRKHVHDDAEIVERQDVPGARVYQGFADWERGYESESETIDDFRVELLGVEELGGRSVADVVIRLRGKGSGADVGERIAHLVDFDGGKPVRWRAFSTLEEARRTAREECVAELYELYGRGDLEGALARVHPEIDWVEPEETIGAERRAGREGAFEGVTQWSESFDSYAGEITALESVGERVVVDFVQRVRAGGSSVAVEDVMFHVWTFRDGLPARMAMYFDREGALGEAAG